MDLEKLLYLQGVGNGFVDCDGHHHTTPATDREAILRAMCHAELADVGEQAFAAWVSQRIASLDARPWQDFLPPFQWCYADALVIRVRVPEVYSGQLTLNIDTEDGTHLSTVCSVADTPVTGDYYTENQLYLERELVLSELVAEHALLSIGEGYHQLTITAASAMPAGMNTALSRGLWMVAPRRSYAADLPQQLSYKPWGVSVQLFSLWSSVASEPRHSGIPTQIGDFRALAEFIRIMAAQGADFIQLNPLHALPLQDAEAASPYSPYDRRRIHPLYISTSLCPEACQADWQKTLPKRMPVNNNGTLWIDYPAAFKIKVTKLKALFKVFSGYPSEHPRRKALAAFVRDAGEDLQFYAKTQAQEVTAPWLKNPEFYLYLQFVAEEQLAFCQELAKDSGMHIGLVRDLAVGAIGTGAEVRQHPRQFCTQASIGAPPDPFAPQGQNWGLTPLDPIGLRQANFGHFITLLRRNMHHCGALRIDHMMGLFRLWWWPVTADADQHGGTYVYYPFDCMMAILLLESQRAGCMLIGEDLGLVPTEIIEPMRRAGIFSNELFYFCVDESRLPQYAGFKPPSEYKPHALMMLANHDVPTMAAWWQGKDLLARHRLGLYSDNELQQAQLRRSHKRKGLLQWLRDMTGQDFAVDVEFCTLLPHWAGAVAAGASELYSVALADLLAEADAVNIPGTSTEYPNWRRRYSIPLEHLSKNSIFTHTLTAVRNARHHTSD
ncbi:4-alpha-glucanotransferase [Shewanella sp. A32]|uniref:4-alpha-glucanotransferase n=1 Tax=Shewanella sp. A32 TaxID=3031327 RepID=UPI0023B92B8A|nr:4-alpha-glucanotransferase [Shewanella sp. A32]MDF0532769.1 4-alpha-glucanotransferase [Shewanella sp. A32]